MAERLELPVAMWRVQYQLLGGHRRMLTALLASVAVLIVGLISAHRMLGGQFAGIAPQILAVLAALQVVLLILGGCNAIYRAVLRDHESRMIESHRLSPMTNLSVSFGYLFGSTLQIMTFVTVLTLAGVGVNFVARFTSTTWLFGTMFLLNGAITMWAATLALSIRQGKPVNPAPILMVIAALGALIVWVPGMALLLNVYSVMLGFLTLIPQMSIPPAALVVVGAVNIVFTAFWLSAAAVKYRRPDLPTLTGGRGLMLLLICLLVGTVGLVAYTRIDLTKWTRPPDDDFLAIQWIATMLGALVLAGVAIAGSVRCRHLGTSGTALRGWADRLSPLLVAVMAAVLICAIMATLGRSFWEALVAGGKNEPSVMDRAWLLSAAACLLATITFRSFVAVCHRLTKTTKGMVTSSTFSVWVALPVIDHIRAQVTNINGGLQFSWLLNCSPIGTIIAAWAPLKVELLPGLLVQLGMLIALEIAAWRLRLRKPQTKS